MSKLLQCLKLLLLVTQFILMLVSIGLFICGIRSLHQSMPSEELFLIHNAKIYASGQPFNSWMTINLLSGLIQSVGRDEAPLSMFSNDSKIDYQGLLILPGFHDSHLHMELYGKKLNELDLKGCSSISELQSSISTYVRSNPDKKWIVGSGWEQDLLGRLPTSEDIDVVCDDVPVFLIRSCYHVAVANQKALDIAGFNETTPEIPGSELVRYPPDHPTKPNKPTGLLKEIPIIMEINKHIPPPSFKDRLKNLEAVLTNLLKHGITSAHPCEENTWTEFCHLAERDRLPIRIFYSAIFTSVGREGIFPEHSKDRREPMLFSSRVKFFVDGALGSRTAALSLPYKCQGHGSHGNDHGMLIYDRGNLTRLIEGVVNEGFRIETHVIGDRAAELVLDILDEIDLDPSQRPIFVHCQILSERLMKRMKKRGVIASIQPQFVNTDARWIHENLPEPLMTFAYPWKTLINRGVQCAGGSDAPVEQPSPLLGIFDAVFRLSGQRDVNDSTAFRPEERLTIEEAIEIFTKGGAYAAMRENDLGKLLPGYLADFVVLDRDIVADPSQALHANVLETWVNGVKRWP